jgi:hypothetical protein
LYVAIVHWAVKIAEKPIVKSFPRFATREGKTPGYGPMICRGRKTGAPGK